jgi:hypothetical protein
MYYSWFNISAELGNNTFYFTYHTASGGSPSLQTVVVPDGIYDVSTLNEYLQFYCISKGFYMISGSGTSAQNVYFIEFALNISKYAVQINCYTVPTSATATTLGWTAPTTGTTITKGFPASAYTTVPTIPANLNKTLGYPAGWVGFNWYSTLPATSQSGTYNGVAYSWIAVNPASTGVVSYLSSTAPQITANSSVYISITGINNPYALPSSIIYAITPSGGVGAIIVDKPPQFAWNKMIDGTYNQLTLTLLGLDLNPLTIKDPDMTFLLCIKDGDEWGGK